MNRAQVSLIFEDDELFSNLVIGLKQSRDLSPFIIRCMSAYYYNPEVRALIDGHEEEQEETVDIQAQLDSMRESILMQAIFAEDGLQELQQGTETIGDILQFSSDKCKDYEESKAANGGTSEASTAQPEPRYNPVQTAPQLEKSVEDNQQTSKDDVILALLTRMSALETQVGKIADLFGKGVNLGAEETKQIYEEPEPSETVSSPVSDESVKPPIVEEPKIEEPQLEDGTDGLLALFESM